MAAYLSLVPEQRSSVKSQYHCATLLGNWEEERRSFGPQVAAEPGMGTTLQQPPTSGGSFMQLDKDTTYTTSYKTCSVEERNAAKPSGTLVAEAPRELLFYHGDLAKPTEKRLLTITEMSFRNPRREEPYTNDEILDRTGVSNRTDKTVALRRSMGFSASSSGRGGSGGATVDTQERSSAAIEKESTFIRSLVGSTDTASRASTDDCGYTVPRLPPVGRVAARDALLTTKNVTIDATGEHLYENLQAYPLTSSVCIGELMASRRNPMHKTGLRQD